MAAAAHDERPLAAAILSGGESRRMGSPKALIPYRGTTFAGHLLDVVKHPRVGIVRVVLGAGADKIRERLQLDPAMIVLNPDWEQGQLSSIQAAVRSLPKDETAGLVLCPVDHPIVSAGLVARLIAEFDSTGAAILLPAYRGRRGHPVIFRAPLYDELLAASPEVGARQVVWAHQIDVVEVPTEEKGIVLNLNDPETLKHAITHSTPE
ncbi:MAG TPA: nucleotidyltransferase family protein [Candidatus Acidoferrales bacterium]|jgi:CTP:molybdopterin cytidylyltransferase MocA|nr:nucleotidyltransferase family protein [Candidatus Acidoferrales bacterium]